MPQRVIEILKIIDIDQKQSDRLPANLCPGNTLQHTVMQQHTVRQAGELVVIRQVGHLRRKRNRLGHILEHNHATDQILLLIADWRSRILYPVFTP